MSARAPTIHNEGLFAIHDQACAVMHQTETAVFDCNRGIFQPSWKAIEAGWFLVHCRYGWQRWALKMMGLLTW